MEQRIYLRILQIFQRVSPGRQDISLYIHPKRKDEVNNKRRAHGKEGNIDEPGADSGSGYTHSLTDCRTHPKYLPLDEVLESVHTANLEIFPKTH